MAIPNVTLGNVNYQKANNYNNNNNTSNSFGNLNGNVAGGSANNSPTKTVNKSGKASEGKKVGARDCDTCNNRSYQDQSTDAGVSFKAPTKLDPSQAASAVMAHEQEHVSAAKAEAQQEGNEIVSQTVVLHSGICPECGISYVAGGTTTTVTASKQKNPFNQTGQIMDKVV